MSAFILSGCFKKKLEIKDTKHFYYSYSVGDYKDASYAYELDLQEEGKYIMSYKADEVSDEDKLTKEVDEEIVKELEHILTDNKVYKWNGFHESDKNVLDGDGFSFIYRRVDKEEISASGYEMYPTGYINLKNDIIALYKKVFEENKSE